MGYAHGDKKLMQEKGDSECTVQRFETEKGGRIYQIPLNAFPGFWVYAYVVIVEDYQVLIDTGSNYHTANVNLDEGLKAAGEMEGGGLNLGDLTHVFITHGHIDHFGGLAYVRRRTNAKIGVHELDRRNLANYEERLEIVSQRLGKYLLTCGVGEERAGEMLAMYMMTKGIYSSGEVDFTYEAAGMQVGPFEFLHTPGHCAGMVVIRLHDVLFTADHVLSKITPHQAPEALTLNTGLGHYLESLEKVKAWGGGSRLALGGHQDPIRDLGMRVDEIIREHEKRLQDFLKILERPATVAGVSKEYFGEVAGYNVLLAVEETGAHIEYLYQRGYLEIDNLAAIQNNGQSPVPVRYRRVFELDRAERLIPGRA